MMLSERIIVTITAIAFLLFNYNACLANGNTAERRARDTPGRINILDFVEHEVTSSEMQIDITSALALAISAANLRTNPTKAHLPLPTCIFIPAGRYKISSPPPPFSGAGCIIGDGSQKTIFDLESSFVGDLFQWSEAWVLHGTSGAEVRGIRINGSRKAQGVQNALMFFDRNDNVTVSDIDIWDLPGRAIASGLVKYTSAPPQAYIRESRFHNIRVFRSGTLSLPAVEFNTQGEGQVDGTNEIDVRTMDIYGSPGRSLVIKNESPGVVRGIKFDGLRVEGLQPWLGFSAGDLVTIGDNQSAARISLIFFNNLQLLNVGPGSASLRLSSGGVPGSGPSNIYVQGWIGGGGKAVAGQGIRVDNGHDISVKLSRLFSIGTNITVGPGVKNLTLDGGGSERSWTYNVHPTSLNQLSVPLRIYGDPSRELLRSMRRGDQAAQSKVISAEALDGPSILRVKLTGSVFRVPADAELVRFVQPDRVDVQEISLALPARDGQLLHLTNYYADIRSLVISPRVIGWVNGSIFPAGGSLRMRWDKVSSIWMVER